MNKPAILTKFQNLEVISYENQIVNIGHSSKSCTYLIHGYDSKRIMKNKKKVFLIDSPGFKDNRGVEIDIANNLSVSLAFKSCSSILPVLVFNYHDMKAKGGNFMTTIDMLISFIKNQDEDEYEKILDSTIILFTNASHDDMDKFISPKINIFYSDIDDDI